MTQSFFKKDTPSPSDKEKLDSIFLLLEKIELLLKKSLTNLSKIQDILDVLHQTINDLSCNTPHLTKEDLLKDVHLLKKMAEKQNLKPMLSYAASMKDGIKDLVKRSEKPAL